MAGEKPVSDDKLNGEDQDPTHSVSGDLGKLLEERARLESLLQKKFRKTITVMFTDLKGSTTLAEEKGDFAARLLIQQHNGILFPIIQKNNGKLVKTMGDGTLSYFESAQDAVRAGVEIQKSVDEFNRTGHPDIPIKLRIGMHTGQGLVEKNDIYGDVVNVASRFESQAGEGEVYISEETWNGMTDKGEIYCSFQKITTLKGKKDPFKIYKAFWKEDEMEADKASPKSFTVEETPKASTSSIVTKTQKLEFDKSSLEVAKELPPAPVASIVVEEAGSPKAVYQLIKDETTIGRSPDCDVYLEETYISRHHASIVREEGNYFIEDLNSKIGVTVNGERTVRGRIKFGDEIFLGEIRITFVAPAQRHPSDRLSPDQGARETVMMTAPQCKVAALSPDGTITEVPLGNEEKIIGRLEECHIRLNDGQVSRRHAKVWEESGKVYIEDLGSGNGTVVDGAVLPKGEPWLFNRKSIAKICGFRLTVLDLADKADPMLFGPPSSAVSIIDKVKGLWDKKEK